MEVFDVDPLRGITRYFDYEEDTGLARIHTVQDVEPLLKYTAEVRATRAADDKLRDDDYMCQYAMIPVTVQLELMKKGINIFNPEHTKKLVQEIEANYPYLKTTGYKHGIAQG
jgi:hypothetical protein